MSGVSLEYENFSAYHLVDRDNWIVV